MDFGEIKVVAEIMGYSRFDFGDERVELEVRCSLVDGERSDEIESPVGKVQVSSVNVSKAKVQGGRGEWRGR